MMSSSSTKSSNYSRTFDLAEDDFRDNYTGAMLPVFLNDIRRNAGGAAVDQSLRREDLVEVTLELQEDDNSIVLCSIAPPTTSDGKGSSSSSAGGFLRRSPSASCRIGRKFSWLRTWSFSSAEADHQELTTRDAMKMKAKLVRTKPSAQRALGGLRFINKTTVDLSEANELWKKVESRFDCLAKDGLLSRIDFADCIGMADSMDFALGVFDALARRRRRDTKIGHITKAELHDFWLQISDQSFDARLQIFFDMADSNEDGRITRDEVQELIMLSASANKLCKLKERAEEYASLIMEELDPENLGYIEIPVTLFRPTLPMIGI